MCVYGIVVSELMRVYATQAKNATLTCATLVCAPGRAQRREITGVVAARLNLPATLDWRDQFAYLDVGAAAAAVMRFGN
jgi:hypothetical protein